MTSAAVASQHTDSYILWILCIFYCIWDIRGMVSRCSAFTAVVCQTRQRDIHDTHTHTYTERSMCVRCVWILFTQIELNAWLLCFVAIPLAVMWCWSIIMFHSRTYTKYLYKLNGIEIGLVALALFPSRSGAGAALVHNRTHLVRWCWWATSVCHHTVQST